jgi:hypothetical protein
VWQDTIGESTKLVCCAVQSFIFLGSTYKLSVLVTVTGDRVDDSVCGVQIGSSVGDLSCEICHVLMDDDMGFTLALFGMVDVVDVVCWEPLSLLALAQSSRGGMVLGPSAA